MPPNPRKMGSRGRNGKTIQSKAKKNPPVEKEVGYGEQIHRSKSQTEFHEEGNSSKVLELFSRVFFWGETHNEQLEKVWSRLPTFFGSFLASLAMFTLGITARGEWMMFAVYIMKYLQTGGSDSFKEESDELVESFQDWVHLRFQGWTPVFIWSAVVSYAMYFGLGGFLHWYYYVRQRDRPEEWKCQPKVWLSPELERHEIMIGSLSLIFGSFISSVTSTYIMNGGWCRIYFQFGEYGLIWALLEVPIVFIWNDYETYWFHRFFHTPWLYKNFHKLHHTYKQPTAFSVTAIHPVEFMIMQSLLILPIFLFPIHWFGFSFILMYTYYHGIIDHSGINFKRKWWQPWQPDCIFHDNHHQYFHVNFGFNIEYWDKLHGTYRRKDRIYREDIFYGTGKSIEDASAEELRQDIAQRVSENPTAYSGNQRHFDLDESQYSHKLK